MGRADRDDRLREVLERARRIGLLGPAPVEDHLAHARAWALALGEPPPRVLDLGSGAGVPGLALAEAWPDTVWTLLDAARRRGEWLVQAVRELGLVDRVAVVVGRAETLARSDELRDGFGLVVARGFGSPATTAECATGFLALGGRLSVSEPPVGGRAESGPSATPSDRWPVPNLAELGFGPPHFVRGRAGFVILRKTTRTDPRWPRRDGVPQHRPLW